MSRTWFKKTSRIIVFSFVFVAVLVTSCQSARAYSEVLTAPDRQSGQHDTAEYSEYSVCSCESVGVLTPYISAFRSYDMLDSLELDENLLAFVSAVLTCPSKALDCPNVIFLDDESPPPKLSIHGWWPIGLARAHI